MDTLTELSTEHTTLSNQLSEQGVKYAVGCWIDVLGRPKSKVVPIDHLPNLVAGSERYTPRGMGGIGRMNPVEDEVVGLPDLSTLKILPWDRRFAWMVADMTVGGQDPFALCPRSVLKRIAAEAADMGYVCQLGIEPEFYVFKPESISAGRLNPIAISGALQPTPAYDLEVALDAMPFLDKVTSYMEDLGFGLFSFDAEGGEGQYEFDYAHDEVVASADRMTLFRLLVKQAAKETGLLATFMPKPFAELWGSGAHFNMSLEDRNSGENVFKTGTGNSGWRKEALHFAGGVLKHAKALAALSNPTTNSYRRLVPRLADGNFSWAPTKISYGHNNRSCMLRLPANRPAIENRSVDTSANTYLTAAFMLAAGLEGIRDGVDPGRPEDIVSYTDDAIDVLPRTLIDAIDAFEADPLTHSVFHPAFVTDYVAMKRSEWQRSHGQVSDAERATYLLNL
ncbi:glutamine synthetase family protein [Mycolicibacterium komossense]|uniref:Glutamate--ammonia ligase n=1 Tax=Mycolicibacterium komossense TaxID=1779 RepID=A0ABT3CFE3_9MYCO|nr:glutamine synthetase family protein [Mycolicibacterium komossense]MCV7228210.1 glutamate--ammonia ligase [Mycolicibacterium komossense]